MNVWSKLDRGKGTYSVSAGKTYSFQRSSGHQNSTYLSRPVYPLQVIVDLRRHCKIDRDSRLLIYQFSMLIVQICSR
ncbi:hypothetical protein RB213_011834, partial [Colletotrichum asianum]